MTISRSACSDYAQCDGPLRAVLTASGLADRLAGRTVLLKPNQMKGTPPAQCNNTDPRLIAALVRWIVEHGGRALVGDSSGIPGFTAEVLTASGMRAAVESAGGTTVDFDAGPFRRLDPPGGAGPYLVPEVLFEVDAVVQVPKLKTHTLFGLSGAVKGLMGILPGATKPRLHVRTGSVAGLAEALLGFHQALDAAGVVLAGGVVDGVAGLAGRGLRRDPVLRRPGVLLAGDDLLQLDLATAELVGFPLEELPLLSRGLELGLLQANLPEVAIEPLAIPFERPTRFLEERLRPVRRAAYTLRERAVSVVHQPERCTRCRTCIEACPVDCITERGPGLHIGDACVRCFACHVRCPEGAMGLRCPGWLRPIFDRRTQGLDTSKMV